MPLSQSGWTLEKGAGYIIGVSFDTSFYQESRLGHLVEEVIGSVDRKPQKFSILAIGEDLERSALNPLHPTCDLFRMLENRSSARSQEPEASI